MYYMNSIFKWVLLNLAFRYNLNINLSYDKIQIIIITEQNDIYLVLPETHGI